MPTFVDHVDFSKSEARNLVTHKLASAPSSPVSGQRYYDTVLNKEGVYNGSSWDYAGSGGGGGSAGPIAGSAVTPVGVSVVDFAIPAGVRRLTLVFSSLIVTASSIVRLGTSAGMTTNGYSTSLVYVGQFVGYDNGFTANGLLVPKVADSTGNSVMTFWRTGTNRWTSTGHSNEEFAGRQQLFTSGNIQLPGDLTTLRFVSTSTINSGLLEILWEF